MKLFQNNKPQLGTWCLLNDPSVIEILSISGFDFCVVDFEHGYHDFSNLPNLLRSADSSGILALVRPPILDESYILRILDSGAKGLMVPNIKSYDQVKDLVRFAFYPPIGERGHSPFTRAGHFSHLNANERMKSINDSLILGILIEGLEAIDALDSILSDFGDYISIVYIGLYDLAKSVGTPGVVTSEKVQNTVKVLAQKCINSSVHLGILANTYEMIDESIQMGASFICYQNDTGILRESSTSIAAYFQDACTSN